MVCNLEAMTDKDLILKLGGPAQVARLLGFGAWGTNRVSNWMVRGIPAAIKVERPDLFMPGSGHKRRSAANAPMSAIASRDKKAA